MLLEKGAYVVDVDVQATKEAYARLPLPDCNHNEWRNYVYATEHAEPEVKAFMSSLGVDIRKPAAMNAYAAADQAMVQYGGSFRLVGKVQQGVSAGQLLYDDEQTILVGNSAVSFAQDAEALKEGFEGPVALMEIFMQLPWVLKRGYA